PALVESSGRLVAFLLAVEGSARRALLVDFAVLPEFRHRGLGHWTLAWSLRALTALGYGEVELWVTETNMEARNLYGRFSFVPRAESAIYRWRRVASSSGRLADPQPHSAR
ncbi:MAG TPA: GNAT family N-acetyltransferase, partial [Thermoplasmata archaeon]|nr:GNAT family N-acetyltransferase [Thermoplasmata archaeon]